MHSRSPTRTLAFLTAAGLFGIAVLGPRAETPTAPALDWPEATQEQRPWTRWWWLGNAVDTNNLTRQLTQFREAGLGGVEICPIYGVRGWEDRQVDYLSPRWMSLLEHTLREAGRLGLGVDLTTGTGWPFGGPWVTTDDASLRVSFEQWTASEGERAYRVPRAGQWTAVVARNAGGERRDLVELSPEGALEWTAPPGEWQVFGVAVRPTGQKVKRAAPGGEGWVIDPYSARALGHYLARFDEAFAGYEGPMPRAFFHDSFEYYGAQWTPELFAEFSRRRGYDLRDELPALVGEGSTDRVSGVRGDYRETLADLHLDYVRRWTDWAARHGGRSRDQAHGAPGNLLDLYAAAGIPETEIFGATEEKYLPMQKLASSSAAVTGKRLVSAESFTWLNEHFHTSLAEAKSACDYLFLAGANHLFYHGIPYSPMEAPWPGWQFYASVNFGPEGGLWRDLPAFNAYITRCQSILQAGLPDHEVLVYLPFPEILQRSDDLLLTLTVHNVERWLVSHPVHAVAMTLWNQGVGYDFVSDRLLQGALSANHRVVLPGGATYRAILVPQVELMPDNTLEKLVGLAEAGATILFQGELPQDVPGWGRREERRARLRNATQGLRLQPGPPGMQQAAVGRGIVRVGTEVRSLLEESGVASEPMVHQGLRFVRRRLGDGHAYFVVNRGTRTVDGWVPLAVSAGAAGLLDPRVADRAGYAALRATSSGATEVYLQLAPGESCVVRTMDRERPPGPGWPYWAANEEPVVLEGEWNIEFTEGGPVLPNAYRTRALESWATSEDPELRRFAGTARYTLEFERPEASTDQWVLNLGRVGASARVRLNGRDIETLWCEPFQVRLGTSIQPGMNRLEIEVTNLAANRIADLDRRGVDWKYFRDANVVGKDYKPLDAARWAPVDSGLLGPVRLIPATSLHPERSEAPEAGEVGHRSAALSRRGTEGVRGRLARQRETLDRGTVALKRPDGSVYVSWRLLAEDSNGVAFNVYRSIAGASPTRVNRAPIVSTTDILDQEPPAEGWVVYSVRALLAGAEGPPHAARAIDVAAPARPYLSVPLRTPAGYSPNDASVGDLDGDGQYEIVLHQSGRGRDNSQAGVTSPPILQAYRLDGALLWEINLGKNIREGAHYTQFMVYDLDGDGRAEVACKTADGTTDGAGRVLGDPEADHVSRAGRTEGKVLDGPEYLSIFDGQTGAALVTVPYVPLRGGPTDWGDDYGNRVDRFLACVAYLDGKRPSLVMCRGYYTRTVLAAWNWRDGELTSVWTFDSDDGGPGHDAYRGQGNHGLSVADVDGDGRDEIAYGACVIDDNGTGLYTTGLGHGDALHLSDLDPDRPGLEVFGIHERPAHPHGVNLREAATGRVIWSKEARDVGRGVALDIDPRHRGAEMWAAGFRELWNARGEVIAATHPRSCNMGIWWDGDSLREVLDGVTITKWDWVGERETPVLNGTDYDCAANNGTKSNPCLCADILGDWREELIARTRDGKELRVFSTTLPAQRRVVTLMQDPVYRLGIAWQNVAYNQPAHLGYDLESVTGRRLTPPSERTAGRGQ